MVSVPVRVTMVPAPPHTALLLAVSVITGLLFTVTVGVVPVAVHPLPSVTVTLYVPVAVGVAVVVLALEFTTPEPVQE